MMPEGLSEKEKWEWIGTQLALHGCPRRGRPKKGEHKVTWSDLGFTRQKAYVARLMAEVPDSEFEAFLRQHPAECNASGRTCSRRRVLVHFKKINVITDDIFDDTDIGRLADAILKQAGSVLKVLNDRQLRYLARSLRFKLLSMAAIRDMQVSRYAGDQPTDPVLP
jgi:hypothetical protein